MSVITVESLNKVMDKLVSAYKRADGTSVSGYGLGEDGDTYGTADALSDMTAFIQETADLEVITALGQKALNLEASLTALKVCAEKMLPFKSVLDAHFRRQQNASYSTLETFLQYYNTGGGGTWQVLQNPEWRDLYNNMMGGSRYPEEYNLFFEVLQGSTYANAIRSKVVGGSETAGATIDSTKYAGGIPSLLVSSFAGTSDTVTVTGTFYDPATKTTSSGVTATFTVTGNGKFYRVAGTAASNALIISASSITIGANITASTRIDVEAERPALRSGTCGADVVSNSTVGLDDNASSITDFYVGYEIATNADNYTKRTITAYNGTTKVATISGTWSTNPTASTSLFRIYRPQLPF